MIDSETREGYPSYIEDATCERIEETLDAHGEWLREILVRWFGHAALKHVPPEQFHYWMRSLAQRVAHQAAGDMAVQSARQADQASQNMLRAVFAGMELGKDSAA